MARRYQSPKRDRIVAMLCSGQPPRAVMDALDINWSNFSGHIAAAVRAGELPVDWRAQLGMPAGPFGPGGRDRSHPSEPRPVVSGEVGISRHSPAAAAGKTGGGAPRRPSPPAPTTAGTLPPGALTPTTCRGCGQWREATELSRLTVGRVTIVRLQCPCREERTWTRTEVAS